MLAGINPWPCTGIYFPFIPGEKWAVGLGDFPSRRLNVLSEWERLSVEAPPCALFSSSVKGQWPIFCGPGMFVLSKE